MKEEDKNNNNSNYDKSIEPYLKHNRAPLKKGERALSEEEFDAEVEKLLSKNNLANIYNPALEIAESINRQRRVIDYNEVINYGLGIILEQARISESVISPWLELSNTINRIRSNSIIDKVANYAETIEYKLVSVPNFQEIIINHIDIPPKSLQVFYNNLYNHIDILEPLMQHLSTTNFDFAYEDFENFDTDILESAELFPTSEKEVEKKVAVLSNVVIYMVLILIVIIVCRNSDIRNKILKEFIVKSCIEKLDKESKKLLEKFLKKFSEK